MTGDVVNVIKDAGSIVGTILSCITLLTIIVKPVRNCVVRFVDRLSGRPDLEAKIDRLAESLQQHFEESREFNQAIVRDLDALKDSDGKILGNTIRGIYNTYKDTKQMPEKEFEMLQKLYATYSNVLHQNGVIEKIYNEITGPESDWEIILE